jgi:hypothetical protein
MAHITFVLLAILTASLASAGPVALDNATLLLNGQQALVLNCQFQSLQVNDPCKSTCCPKCCPLRGHPFLHNANWYLTDGDIACIQGDTATCVDDTWQTLPCPSSKSCFALPQVRTNGTVRAVPHFTPVVP